MIEIKQDETYLAPTIITDGASLDSIEECLEHFLCTGYKHIIYKDNFKSDNIEIVKI